MERVIEEEEFVEWKSTWRGARVPLGLLSCGVEDDGFMWYLHNVCMAKIVPR